MKGSAIMLKARVTVRLADTREVFEVDAIAAGEVSIHREPNDSWSVTHRDEVVIHSLPLQEWAIAAANLLEAASGILGRPINPEALRTFDEFVEWRERTFARFFPHCPAED